MYMYICICTHYRYTHVDALIPIQSRSFPDSLDEHQGNTQSSPQLSRTGGPLFGLGFAAGRQRDTGVVHG